MPIDLARGVATIPLKGIDVPFHSTYLRPGVQSYRDALRERIKENDVHPHKLVGKFIPNLLGRAFSLDKQYAEDVFKLTGSPVLQELISNGSFH